MKVLFKSLIFLGILFHVNLTHAAVWNPIPQGDFEKLARLYPTSTGFLPASYYEELYSISVPPSQTLTGEERWDMFVYKMLMSFVCARGPEEEYLQILRDREKELTPQTLRKEAVQNLDQGKPNFLYLAFFNLPIELRLLILQDLDPTSLGSFACAAKATRALANRLITESREFIQCLENQEGPERTGDTFQQEIRLLKRRHLRSIHNLSGISRTIARYLPLHSISLDPRFIEIQLNRWNDHSPQSRLEKINKMSGLTYRQIFALLWRSAVHDDERALVIRYISHFLGELRLETDETQYLIYNIVQHRFTRAADSETLFLHLNEKFVEFQRDLEFFKNLPRSRHQKRAKP